MARFRLHFEELKASGDLPSPTGVALSVFHLTRKPDVSLSEIAHVVKADPSLSGKLIKSANLLKAGTRVIASVSDALNLLGLAAIRQLVVGFSVLAGNRRGTCENFDYMRFWSKSLAAAIIAQMLCERERVAQPEECFIGMLLSDVGSLALATIYPVAYSEVLSNTPAADELLEWERISFAIDHRELTAALLEDWMLPPMFVNAALCHESLDETSFPRDSRDYALCRIWHFSGKLAGKFVAGDGEIARSMPEFIRMAAQWNLEPEDFAVLSNEAVAKWREWSRIMEVPSRSLPDFAEMMANLPQQAPAPEPPDPHMEFPLRILAVDGELAPLESLIRDISSLGHAVDVATNAADALRVALETDPQLIVCGLASESVLEFSRALRELPAGRFIYLIVLTPELGEDALAEVFAAGADAVMVKPYRAIELGARVLAGQRFVRIREELLRQSEELRNIAAELAVTNRRAQRDSLTDQLSGLPNRRYAIERLATEWKRTLVLSCLMVDVDRFKSVNDNYGHGMGDEVIRHIARILHKASRSQDTICRFGGEEFLAILPNVNLTAAMICAERFRAAIETSPFVKGNIRIELTVSIGVAERRPVMKNFENLIKAADVALYAAKQDGRNLVRQTKGRV